MKGSAFVRMVSLGILLLNAGYVNAQEDSIQKNKTTFLEKMYERVSQAVTIKNPGDTTALKLSVENTRSESTFLPYQGKVIRSISTQELGFEITFLDTSKSVNYFGTRILNALHADSKSWVIRNNLFIKKDSRVNPYVFADNERYLRGLEFIQDARIIIKPIKDNADSVDVVVITKDLFSLTGSLDLGGTTRQKISIAEINLAGSGQKVQLSGLRDVDRSPVFGYDFLYKKTNIAHSFINASAGYSQIKRDKTQNEAEQSLFLQLDKPLISPYNYFAGALNLSFNQNRNLYNKPDSLFYSYRYTNIDVWAGHNMGVAKLIQNNSERSRSFIAARYFSSVFDKIPYQVGNNFNPFFNTRKGLLGELTFFKQNFYKTNYIYGFGTTEDVPYGYNVAITAGWYQQVSLRRPYVGFSASRYTIAAKGHFMEYYLRAGGFWNKRRLQDASFIAGTSLYSRLFLFDHFKMRQYMKASYSRIFNYLANDPLRIDNTLGLHYFNADSLKGTQRLSLYSETFFFARYKLLGFQLAPFAFLDATVLTPRKQDFFKSDVYTGIGGGIRIRNENLVFGTMELRLVYFPRTVQDNNAFKITFRANLRFRYNSNYVKAPDIIQLNSEDINSFY